MEGWNRTIMTHMKQMGNRSIRAKLHVCEKCGKDYYKTSPREWLDYTKSFICDKCK